MKPFMRKTLAAAILTAHLPVAYAGFTISPMVGQYLFDNDMDLDNEVFGSIALGYQLDSPLAFELSYLKTNPDFSSSAGDMDIEDIRLDLLYNFNHTESVVPYLLIGGGNQNYQHGPYDYDSSIFNFGGGVKAFITDGLALRAEVRLVNDMDEELTGYNVGIGLSYEFGRKTGPKTPPDSDGDGVMDSSDLCPGTAAGSTVDANGCVVVLDDDNDGVPNNMDNCPDTSIGAAVDAVGCYVIITETKEVTMNINFPTNSAEVPMSDYPDIEEIANFMKQYPLTEVTIEGHSDDRGAAAYNQQLSQKRAESVAKVLTDRYGIYESRVKAIGYGESQPLVDNSTPENRARNRRVTAKVTAKVETIKQ